MNKYIIFGTGSVAEKYYNQIVKIHGLDSVEFFLDSMLYKQEFLGKEVRHPSYLETIHNEHYIYILGSVGSTNSMRQELLLRGIPERNIIEYNSTSEEKMFKEIPYISNILFYPEIKDVQLIKKIQYLIIRDIPLFKKANLKFHIITTERSILDFIEPYEYIKKTICPKFNHFDLVMIWNYEVFFEVELESYKHVYCIDPLFYHIIDRKVFIRLNNRIGLQLYKDYYMNISLQNFKKLKNYDLHTAYVFGNGPSMEEGIIKYSKLIDNKKNKALTIVCNAFILSGSDIINIVQPNIYVLIDILFLTEEYDLILETIIKYILETNCILVIPDFWIPYLCKRFNHIDNHLMGLSFDALNICIPDENNLSIYYKAGNVITAVAIPIASSLSNVIYISGCDGIDLAKDINKSWPHSNLANHKIDSYENSNEKLDSFIKHNNFFNEIIKYGENNGKQYYSITHSYIPALDTRMLPDSYCLNI